MRYPHHPTLRPARGGQFELCASEITVTLFGWCFELRKSAATSSLRSVRCIQSGSLMATLIQPRVVRDRLFSAHGVRMHSFCIVRPPHSGTQEEALHWLADAHIRAEETHHLNNGLPPIDPSFAALMPKLLRRYG